MAAVLKNVVAFANIAPGVPTTLPHGLIDAYGRGLIPDEVHLDDGPFAVLAADATTITLRNDGVAAASVNVLCEYWHTIPRILPASVLNLTPRPFIPAGSAPTSPVSPDRTITVSPANADVATIAAGLAAAAALVPAPSTANPATVLVYPGVYGEPPLTVPGGVSLIGIGGAEVTRVVATTPTAALLTVDPEGSACHMDLSGANGAGGVGVLANGVGLAELVHLHVHDCTVGYRATGAGVALRLWEGTAARAVGEVMTTAYEALAGATLTVFVSVAAGSVGAPIATGYLADGAGTVLHASGLTIHYCDDAVVSDNGADAQIWSGEIANYVNGFQTNNGSELHAFSCDLPGTGTRDLWVRNAADVFHGTGNALRSDKTFVAAGASVVSVATSDLPGDEGNFILGELSVGYPNQPAESVFGEGDSHVRGMAVFRNTNLEVGAWSDITAQMASISGSTADAFAGVAAGNTLYIGGDLPFPGNKIDTTAAIVLGAGSLVWEYWNGAVWTALHVVACDSNLPYAQHAQDTFGRINQEQVRHQPKVGWATKLLNGTTKYWLRCRVVGGITTSPTLEQIKLGTNRTEINGDGIVEHFGTAEKIKDLVWHQRLVNDLVGSASGNANVVMSANISVAMTDNQFADNQADGIAGIIEIPEGLDTAHPLSLVFAWIPKATGGDVEFESRSAPVRLGDTLDGSLPDALQTQIITAPGIDVLVENYFDYDVSSLVPGDFLAFSLFRDATGGNPDDTLAGNVNIVLMAVQGTFWR
jgi:hypothetical protein